MQKDMVQDFNNMTPIMTMAFMWIITNNSE
jgi:hypothetical protein